MKKIYIFMAIAAVSIVTISIINSTKTEIYNNVKVIDKQQQQLIGRDNTEIRYLVITDKGTFICESSILNGKFNNSDIFWRLKKDSTYSYIKVCGFGKGFFYDYQNILEVK